MSTATEVREPEVQKPVEVRRAPQAPLSPIPARERPLFADVLLETSSLQRRRRSLAAILSLVFQCSLLGGVLILPLMFTENLPKQQLLSFLVAPPPPPPPPPPAASAAAVKVVERAGTDIMDGRLRTPGRIPQKVQMIREDAAPPALSSGGVIGGVPGGVPGGQLGGVIGGIISSASTLASVPKLAPPFPAAPKRIRISQGVTRGSLIQKIEPAYPTLARAARVQGQVVLTAIISKTGEIQDLMLVSGHPMLVPAAVEAVKQWRYRPFLLNGEPVEVETTITVTFQLSG
ncbi:MAG: energy transducer TonB [Candidatus Sulfotelmatobacter sp.]